MKRKTIVAFIILIIVLASNVMCFAAPSLEIVSSYPKNGQKNTSMENLGIKIYFNNEINDEKNQKTNIQAVSLVDEKGVKVPIKVLFSDKEKKMMLAVADLNNSKYKVLNNAKYKLQIGPNFVDNSGVQIGKLQTITFQTYNQKANNLVNMGMMVVMFGGLCLVSMKNKKKKEDEEVQEESFNPYKEAKRTGKTIEEVKAEQAKKEAKRAKKKRKNNNETSYEKHIENCAELLNNVYHVHKPAPINKEDRSIEALSRLRRNQKKNDKAKKSTSKSKKKKK